MWGNYQFKVAASSARGHSGGILMVWDLSVFICSRVISLPNILIVGGCFSGSSITCYLMNIYAPQSRVLKRHLWAYILSFMNNNRGEYIIFGNFNAVRFPHEVVRVRFCPLEANEFNSFITNGNLVDVLLGGRSFTRANKAFTNRSLLDRFLVTNGIMSLFPSIMGSILSDIWSDHCPIILKNDVVDYGPIPFKLFHSWFNVDGFDEVVVNA
ncbi:uncharacterized protein [Rutidosis leptorrhynchoides]|uniref:uncharacterized protein n=1 Tax=Rutidosis leptorrhynchoides TaxID=125765 RepID=UPI003A997B48